MYWIVDDRCIGRDISLWDSMYSWDHVEDERLDIARVHRLVEIVVVRGSSSLGMACSLLVLCRIWLAKSEHNMSIRIAQTAQRSIDYPSEISIITREDQTHRVCTCEEKQ